ncbi:lysine N(6)-hydroxylase/L-ornithine N(5)-oxygenase family protein [Streptomyces sp. NBC_01214]|uniref:SidA/IucD/PvdA family monooxygenase n=1 Tax=Streptomyces sp. NBC_01214 TaxID=2903777 RepID=UPI002259BC6F|nr:SidA/IucD/PvdA family monooxygenase [Streptomyces sp. NBC_01214]MCX4802920.1 lysine N(6)-hydroxylase/L-ornithine N(5)-oxygenase family protein [Streptomyces sp. NBC_01214]
MQEGRVFRFLEANRLSCSRREFEQYFQWAAAQLPSVRLDPRRVGDALRPALRGHVCGRGRPTTCTLLLGSGSEAHLPDFAKPFVGNPVLHSSQLTAVRPEWKDRRVRVVGGAGQSGAETVSHLLSDEKVFDRAGFALLRTHALPA